MDTAVIIVSAGNSSRMNGKDKQFAKICGIPTVVRSMLAFEKCESVLEMIVVTKAESIGEIRKLASEHGITKLKDVTEGGNTRQESVFNGVRLISDEAKMIAVHDGARPLVSPENIEKTIADARIFGGAVLGVPVKDTIKTVSDGLITDTPPRSSLYITQTPQIFKRSVYFRGMEFARRNYLDFTDDCQLAEATGVKVCMTVGDYKNIKITTPEDIAIAEAILRNDEQEEKKMFRTGHGYDVHKLAENRKLILGGVDIPHEKGLLGHSDADVLVHAVMDALLGAAALGDIGKHFPDNDDEYKGADSLKLLERVSEIIRNEGYTIVNIDSTVIAQAPKLAPYIETMRKNIADSAGCDVSAVSVKATTEEHLGFTGEKLGISAHAVCLISK